MRKLSIILIVTLLLPVAVSAKKVYESEKIVTHSYAATSNHTLTVENKYGNINIEIWDKNEVSATITITGKSSRSQELANDLVNRVKINASTAGNNIVFITELAPMSISGSGSHSSDIYYQIKVPRNIAFNLTNKYGSINIDEAGSRAIVDVKYGNFNCIKMSGSAANLTLGYGNANIQEVNNLTADIKYSNMTLGKASSLKLTTKYSNFKFDVIGSLSTVAGYDSYTINEITSADIDAKYTPIKIGKANQHLNITNKYGSVKIDGIGKDISSLSFNLGYTDLKLNIPSNISYEFELSSKYGNITLPSNIPTDIKHKEKSGSTTTLRGTAGNGKANLKVKVTNSYADISITSK